MARLQHSLAWSMSSLKNRSLCKRDWGLCVQRFLVFWKNLLRTLKITVNGIQIQIQSITFNNLTNNKSLWISLVRWIDFWIDDWLFKSLKTFHRHRGCFWQRRFQENWSFTLFYLLTSRAKLWIVNILDLLSLDEVYGWNRSAREWPFVE